MTSPSPSELAAQLKKLGFRVLPDQLEDFLGRAKKGRWSTRSALAEMARLEEIERSRRSLERRLGNARIGRFKPLVDFDWDWPKKIDRPLIERALTLDFVPEGRNLILLGANGLGKTMITQNIAHAAVLAGHSVLFRTASELLDDLQLDSSELLRRRLKKYARPSLLCIDEVGYLSYDCHAADLLYEHRSIIVTTNRAFKDWNVVFPNATCIVSLLDRLTHHADITVIRRRKLSPPRKRAGGGRSPQTRLSASLQRRAYVQAVLAAYLGLPDTPPRSRPPDRRLAGQLHDRKIPLPTVIDALLLAAARRVLRSQDAHPLASVRSLYYFVPVIEELLETPLPKGYSRYLQRKIAALSTDCGQDSPSADP